MLKRRESGQVLSEYGIILAFVAVPVVIVATNLGGGVKDLFNNIVFKMDNVSVHEFVEPEVGIDIKPGSAPNSINCTNDKGLIPVAILTTEDFDATTVDHTTVTFEGASEKHVNIFSGNPRRHEEDVDGDGDTDLVFHFRLGDTDLTCDSTEGTLTGENFDGQAIGGTDTVNMVG